MFIRSQNKERLVPCELGYLDINNYHTYGQCEIVMNSLNVDNSIILGTYSSETKAIKVLDMIQDKYSRYVTTFNRIPEEDRTVIGMQLDYCVPTVFEMPQDEDV